MNEVSIELSLPSDSEYKESLFFDALKKMKMKKKNIIEPKKFLIRRGILLDDIKTVLWVEVYVFENLISYLWGRYNEGDDIMMIYRKVRNHKDRVIDIAWGVDKENYSVEHLNNKQRTKLLLFIVRELKKLYNQVVSGNGGFKVNRKELITGYPFGEKRDVMTSRFGFSNKKKDGWCYARLNAENRMIPY